MIVESSQQVKVNHPIRIFCIIMQLYSSSEACAICYYYNMNLTEASYYVRKFAPVFVLFFVIILILFYSVKLFFLLIDANKRPVTYINPIFKEIPPPTFKKEATTSAGFSFSLDTIEGKPVTATDTAKVYFIPRSPLTLNYTSAIYLMARSFGFDTEKVKHVLINNEAYFDDGMQRLRVNIQTLNFRYDYDMGKDSALIDSAGVLAKETAENEAINFLKSIDRYPVEFSQGKTNTIYMQYDKVASRSSVIDIPDMANMIEIDFFRPDTFGYPVVTSSYFNSQNYVMYMGGQNGRVGRLVSAQIQFFEKSEENIGVYPLVSGQQAYERLLAGKATLISSGTTKRNRTIKRMFLGYFDPDIYQEYFQPVYVFLGDNDFVAYVPAVADSYLINAEKLISPTP